MNLHKLIIKPHTLTSLVGIDTQSSSQPLLQMSHPQPSHIACFKFLNVVAEFNKQHGYQAHGRRCTETGTSCEGKQQLCSCWYCLTKDTALLQDTSPALMPEYQEKGIVTEIIQISTTFLPLYGTDKNFPKCLKMKMCSLLW